MDRLYKESLTILGISPEGVKKRLGDCGTEMKEPDCVSSAYGTTIRWNPGHESGNIKLIERCCAPFVVPGDLSPARLLVQSALRERALLVFAESCTGGLAGSMLTGIAGSSDVFWGSMVTYANEAKERVLGVSCIPAHGAVSEATVKAMAQGAIELSGASAALAVSGIAGPGGGTPDKPVGTVWFAFMYREKMQTLQCVFSGKRAQVRRKAAAVALAGLANQIDGALLDTEWIADYTCY
jgi:nicotinamide-nucleotide amidase